MTAILALVPRWLWAALVAALAATSCKLTIDLGAVKLELEKTKVVHEQERANQLAVLASAQERARQAEQTLTETTVTIREESHAQVLAARADADRLRDRLRAQLNPPRAAASVMPGAAQVAATAATADSAGAQLPAGVGDDLVSLALRAEELRADAQACRRQYDAARSALEAMK